MAWPGDIEFQDAIQNPQHCFSDAILRSGKAEQDQFGDLWMTQGAFANVFQIASGGRRYAVRCFKAPVTDQKRRYQVIGDYLKRQTQDVFAGFEFQPNGIKVDGQFYPIVRMDWVNGETLDDVVKKNLRKPGVLQGLRDEFRRLVKALRACGVAHGDLQHRNIMVTPQRKMRVVDYDGMFVPPIKSVSKLAPELGHPDFQHPRRAPGDFDGKLDNFSALVIYLSLWALAEQPGLWKEFNNENNLIFLKEDFTNQNSKLMRRLVASANPGLRKLTEILRNQCQRASASQVRDLEDALRDVPQAVAAPVAQADIMVTDAVGQEIDALACTLAADTAAGQLVFFLRNEGQASTEVQVSAKEPWLQVDGGASVTLAPGAQHKVSLRVSAAPAAADLIITAGNWWGVSQTQNLPLKVLRTPASQVVSQSGAAQPGAGWFPSTATHASPPGGPSTPTSVAQGAEIARALVAKASPLVRASLETVSPRTPYVMAGLGLVSGLLTGLVPFFPDWIPKSAGPVIIQDDQAPILAPVFFAVVMVAALRLDGHRDRRAALTMLAAVGLAWLAAVNAAFYSEPAIVSWLSDIVPAIDSASGRATIAGLAAGAIGAAVTALGFCYCSKSLRDRRLIATIVLVGAGAGLLLPTNFASKSQSDLLSLFVIWQSTVAAAFGYALTRVRPAAPRMQVSWLP
jgi:hypothetical protein